MIISDITKYIPDYVHATGANVERVTRLANLLCELCEHFVGIGRKYAEEGRHCPTDGAFLKAAMEIFATDDSEEMEGVAELLRESFKDGWRERIR